MKRIVSLFLMLFILFLIPLISKADDFSKSHGDFFKLLLNDNSDVRLSYTLEKGQKDKDTSAKYDLDYFNLSGELPSALSRDSFTRFGFDYGLRMYQFEGTNNFLGGLDSEELHRIKFSPGYGTFINDNLLLTGIADIGLFSNFKKTPDFDQLKYYANAKLAWRLNPGSLVYLGVEKSDNFDGVTLFPLLGIKLLTEGGEFKINLDLPKQLKLDYNITSKSQLYFLVCVLGEKYRITAGDPEKEFNVFIQDKRVGLGANHWFTNHVGLNFEAGLSIASDLEFETLDTRGYFGEMDTGGYLSAAIKVAL